MPTTRRLLESCLLLFCGACSFEPVLDGKTYWPCAANNRCREGCVCLDDRACVPTKAGVPPSTCSPCDELHGDCNNDARDGCETALANDSDNCGGCGKRCQTEQCAEGVCQPSDSCGGCDDRVPCTADTCDQTSHTCDHVPTDSYCDDGVSCTSDICDAVLGCTNTPRDELCSDGIACTSDSCDPVNGCRRTPMDTECDNGIACDGIEICDPSEGCKPGRPLCDDEIGCTIDYCDEATKTCSHIKSNAHCDNGQFCDGAETCDLLSGCKAGSPPCADGLNCTVDICAPETGGCAHEPRCDDGIDCTIDACDEATANCAHTPDDLPCNDGNRCNGIERCYPSYGGCFVSAIICDDGNPCTDDVCNPAVGCVFTPNVNVCDDGNPCTGQDTCYAGGCFGRPLAVGAPCTPDGGRGKNAIYCQNGQCTFWCNTSDGTFTTADHVCPAGFYCQPYQDTDSAGFCAASSGGVTTTGEPCAGDNECRSNWCNGQCLDVCSGRDDCPVARGWTCRLSELSGPPPYQHGVCGPPTGGGLTGSPCNSNLDCRDGYCDLDFGVCGDICCTEADCPPNSEYACWFVEGQSQSVSRHCVVKGLPGPGGLDTPCNGTNHFDPICASGLCLNVGAEQRCSRFCCNDSDCGDPRYRCDFAFTAANGGWVRACVRHPTCAEKYGKAPDFVLCVEAPNLCTFNALTVDGVIQRNCTQVCGDWDGSCVAAFDNPDGSRGACVDLSRGDTCDTIRSTEICVCRLD